MPKNTDDTFEFRGFRNPNYTQVPDELFDYLLPALSGAELKVLLYIMRRTFGFKRESDTISLAQMLHGIQSREGRILDRGTGLSKPALLQALRSLEDKNIIESERRRSAERGDEPTSYKVKFLEAGGGQESLPPVVKKVDQGGGQKSLPGPWSKKLTTQDTVVQETVEQETDNSNIRRVSPSIFSGEAADLPKDPSRPGTVSASFRTVGSVLAQAHPRPASVTYDEDRQIILNYIQDFAREFNDRASLKTSTTRAYNLFREAQVSRDDFIARLYEAEALTKERTASIRSTSRDSIHVYPLKHKMPYFFAILEDLLGLRPDNAARSDTTGSRTRPGSDLGTGGDRTQSAPKERP